MKVPKKMNLAILCFTVLFTCISNKSFSQKYHVNNAKSELKVYGTSNLHDWDIVTEDQNGYVILEKDNFPAIMDMKIDAVSESLKSGKNGMDKNTYKALNTDKYKTITFLLTECKSISKLKDETYKIESYGDLTISGVTKKIALNFNLKISDNEIHLTGEKSFNMTDFNIEPPTALFGTITTGDEVTIKFNTILIQYHINTIK